MDKRSDGEHMVLNLPSFSNTHCIAITACAEVTNAPPELAKWMKAATPVVTTVGKGAEKGVLCLNFGGRARKHLHIDFSKSDYYQKPKTQASAALSEVEQVLEKFSQLEVKATFRARFEVKLDELPEGGIVRSLMIKSKTGTVALEVSGASLDITGAPVDSIKWLTLSDSLIGVIIDAENVKTRVSANYLIDGVKRLEEALSVFVLGKTANERTAS